jgi:hypothetical protein
MNKIKFIQVAFNYCASMFGNYKKNLDKTNLASLLKPKTPLGLSIYLIANFHLNIIQEQIVF